MAHVINSGSSIVIFSGQSHGQVCISTVNITVHKYIHFFHSNRRLVHRWKNPVALSSFKTVSTLIQTTHPNQPLLDPTYLEEMANAKRKQVVESRPTLERPHREDDEEEADDARSKTPKRASSSRKSTFRTPQRRVVRTNDWQNEAIECTFTIRLEGETLRKLLASTDGSAMQLTNLPVQVTCPNPQLQQRLSASMKPFTLRQSVTASRIPTTSTRERTHRPASSTHHPTGCSAVVTPDKHAQPGKDALEDFLANQGIGLHDMEQTPQEEHRQPTKSSNQKRRYRMLS